ncbi:hypothetical protein ACX0G9_18795 [Flavitalea flava]
MRNIFLPFAPVLLSATLTVSAQGVFSNKTQSTLEKVIQDYPNHFFNIKGELIGQTRQAKEYKSTLQLPGATSCIVTLYSVPRNEAYGWSCLVYEAGNFDQAKSRFTEIYDQIRNSIIKISGQKTFILTGQFESPAEEKKYTQVIFSLLPGVGEMKKLKVELSLREEGKGWKIALSVNDQETKGYEREAVTLN